MKVYVVQAGDSLYKIAKRFSLPLETLIAANPQIADPSVLGIGQQIRIPELPGTIPYESYLSPQPPQTLPTESVMPPSFPPIHLDTDLDFHFTNIHQESTSQVLPKPPITSPKPTPLSKPYKQELYHQESTSIQRKRDAEKVICYEPLCPLVKEKYQEVPFVAMQKIESSSLWLSDSKWLAQSSY